MPTKLLIVVATISWGVWGFALKKAVAHMPPLSAYVVLAATNIALVPLYVLLARAFGTKLDFVTGGVVWAAAAAFAVGIGSVAMLYAMKTSDASSTVAMTAAYPVVTLLLAVLFLNEPITATRVAGVGLVAAGAVLLGR